MKKIILLVVLITSSSGFAQPNCFVYPEESGERKACELSYKAIEFQQGSKESQMLFDEAIAMGPKFAWAYYQKSVPYFKRGFLYEGLQLLNEAVALEPITYLSYRAYWYWQYRNYALCIQDLEQYYALPKAYMQHTPGGEKDMRILLGLAYAKIGKYAKGIEILKACINDHESEDYVGLADYHSLGVLYVLNKQYEKAIEVLEKQLTVLEDMADTYYYLGLAHKGLSNLKEANIQFNKSLEIFDKQNRFRNTNAGFIVYPSDVKHELGTN